MVKKNVRLNQIKTRSPDEISNPFLGLSFSTSSTLFFISSLAPSLLHHFADCNRSVPIFAQTGLVLLFLVKVTLVSIIAPLNRGRLDPDQTLLTRSPSILCNPHASRSREDHLDICRQYITAVVMQPTLRLSDQRLSANRSVNVPHSNLGDTSQLPGFINHMLFRSSDLETRIIMSLYARQSSKRFQHPCDEMPNWHIV